MSDKAQLQARLVDYLERIGAEPIQRGDSWKALCPLHDDSNPSLTVSLRNGVPLWKCWPCDKGGDVFTLHSELTGCDFKNALTGVAEVLRVSLSDSVWQRGDRTPLPRPPRKSKPVPKLPADFEEKHRQARSALYDSPDLQAELAAELNLEAETIRAATFTESALGYSESLNRFVYCYPSGIKVRGREGDKSRFWWSCGAAERPWRFHAVESPDLGMVVVTESESDCLALVQAGIETLGGEEGKATTVVALPGTSFPENWGELFSGQEVILAFDNDEAGRTATDRFATVLAPHVVSVKSWKWEGATV